MANAEFDEYAKDYVSLHEEVLGVTGENAQFFVEYKIMDLVQYISKFEYPQSLSILDFGAGIGQSVPFFKEKIPLVKLTCLDVSFKSLQIAQERWGKMAQYLTFDGTNIPVANKSCHVVFAACVFHHISCEKYPQIIKEIYRVLKDDGIFLLFEHNSRNFLTVKAVEKCVFDKDAVLVNENVLSELLRDSGFSRRYVAYRLFFPHILRFLRPLERYMTWLPFGGQYSICSQK